MNTVSTRDNSQRVSDLIAQARGNGRTNTPSGSEILAELEKLRAENSVLREKAQNRSNIVFKVGEKGGVSVYGINTRFPVSLYAAQWERLLSKKDDLLAFIAANADKLERK